MDAYVHRLHMARRTAERDLMRSSLTSQQRAAQRAELNKDFSAELTRATRYAERDAERELMASALNSQQRTASRKMGHTASHPPHAVPLERNPMVMAQPWVAYAEAQARAYAGAQAQAHAWCTGYNQGGMPMAYQPSPCMPGPVHIMPHSSRLPHEPNGEYYGVRASPLPHEPNGEHGASPLERSCSCLEPVEPAIWSKHWGELTGPELAAAKHLGWSPHAWDNGDAPEQVFARTWAAALQPEERAAAELLGFDEGSWDELQPTPPFRTFEEEEYANATADAATAKTAVLEAESAPEAQKNGALAQQLAALEAQLATLRVRAEAAEATTTAEQAEAPPPSPPDSDDLAVSLPEFTCPITCKLMQDPVCTVDGQAYERAAIQQWLASHTSSPLTGEPLASTALVPNLALRNAIGRLRGAVKRLRAGSLPAPADEDGAPADKSWPTPAETVCHAAQP